MISTRWTPCGNDRETKATNLSKKLLRRKPSMFSIWVLWQEKYIESHCNSTNTSQHSNFKTVTEGSKQTKPPTHLRMSPNIFIFKTQLKNKGGTAPLIAFQTFVISVHGFTVPFLMICYSMTVGPGRCSSQSFVWWSSCKPYVAEPQRLLGAGPQGLRLSQCWAAHPTGRREDVVMISPRAELLLKV